MAGLAARDRAMAFQRRRGIAVAFETKRMESRFYAEPNFGTAAAMTIDAVVEPSAIGKIMVAR
jgi:hypothetical protein